MGGKLSYDPCPIPGCKVRSAWYGLYIKTCGRHVNTLAHLRLEAIRWEATIDEDSIRAQFVNVEAPAGMVWAASSTHALKVDWGTPGDSYGGDGDPAIKRDAILDAIERMAEGLADCDEPDCDFCHPEA
jgi:hypothetical protein